MDRQNIIRRLAEQVTEDELRRIFPEIPPDDIRDILLEKKRPPGNGNSRQNENLRCSLYTDGASRGNPGPAGAGAILFDADGRELATKAQFLGRCTNNVAEYKALILGLLLADKIGCRHLDIFLDSELIVRQLTGRYKVKNPSLKSLFSQAQQLLQGFTGFSVSHIPRAKNSRADKLANQGIDERSSDD